MSNEPTLSKTIKQMVEFTAAYDERTRKFNELRNLKLTDEQIAQAREAYATAAKAFDKLRADIVK